MTFDEIVADVADRLNITSPAGITRIGKFVNHRYKMVSSDIGLDTVARTYVTANTVIGDQSVVFSGIEKIYAVVDPATTPPRILGERTMDQLRHTVLGTDPPGLYAIQLMGANSVTIKLDCVPATIYALGADGDADLSTLSGTTQPALAAKFHDVLVYGAMAEELDKMEKYDLAKKQENMYAMRLSQLRFYIAKSAYKQIWQGRNETSPGRPGIIL